MSERRVVYGVGPVGELIRSSSAKIDCLFVAEKRLANRSDAVAALVAEAKQRSILYSIVVSAELDGMTERGVHQGIVALTGAFEYSDLHDVVNAAAEPGLVVALDGVTDPHNVGAVLRSAYLLGADAVLVPKDRAAKVTPLVTKVSAGASEHIDVVQVTNLVRSIEELKEHGFWSVAVETDSKAVPLRALDTALPLVVVVGSEGKGIRPLVRRVCDFQVEIPMAASAIGSFNVSVATGIVLYEISRQRSLASS